MSGSESISSRRIDDGGIFLTKSLILVISIVLICVILIHLPFDALIPGAPGTKSARVPSHAPPASIEITVVPLAEINAVTPLSLRPLRHHTVTDTGEHFANSRQPRSRMPPNFIFSLQCKSSFPLFVSYMIHNALFNYCVMHDTKVFCP